MHPMKLLSATILLALSAATHASDLGYAKISGTPVVTAVDVIRSVDIPDDISLEKGPLRSVLKSGKISYEDIKGTGFHSCYSRAVSSLSEDQKGRHNDEYRRLTKQDGSGCVSKMATHNEELIRTSGWFYLPYKGSSVSTIMIGGRSRYALSAGTGSKGRIVDFFDVYSRNPKLLGESSERNLSVSIQGPHYDPLPVPANSRIQRELTGIVLNNPESLGLSSWDAIGTDYFLAIKARMKSYNTVYSAGFKGADSEVLIDASELAIVSLESGKPIAVVPFSDQNVVYSWRLANARVSDSEVIAVEVAGRIIPAKKHAHIQSKFYEHIKAQGVLDQYDSMSIDAFKEILSNTADADIQK